MLVAPSREMELGKPTVGYGPAELPMRGLKVVAREDIGADDLPHGKSETLVLGLDVDSSGSVDVAVYVYDCARGPRALPAGTGPGSRICIDLFARSGSGWAAPERTDVAQCQ